LEKPVKDFSEPRGELLRDFPRRAIKVSQDTVVKREFLKNESPPLVIRPALRGLNLIAWTAMNRELLDAELSTHGAMLFRGFGLSSAEEFEQFMKAFSVEMLDYRERSSPRSRVLGNVYTSTDYPANYSIFLHNENSYQACWPLRIAFFCHTPAQQGGETPIADCRKIFSSLADRVKDEFIGRKVLYVRNFGNGVGLPWQEVFQTSDRRNVEAHCRAAGIEVCWKGKDQLRTSVVRPAIARHPRTGEIVWFNHATFFHVTTLEPAIRRVLMAELSEEDLPNNTYYGDGSPIEPSVMDELRDQYERHKISFPWERGDILMLDNMFVAHGRAQFVGPRKILVGMMEAVGDRGV
jgi:alpha-ketoglutarate-dependent taurine dioxygenase